MTSIGSKCALQISLSLSLGKSSRNFNWFQMCSNWFFYFQSSSPVKIPRHIASALTKLFFIVKLNQSKLRVETPPKMKSAKLMKYMHILSERPLLALFQLYHYAVKLLCTGYLGLLPYLPLIISSILSVSRYHYTLPSSFVPTTSTRDISQQAS